MGAYLRKLAKCKCGNELGIFGKKCDTCRGKAIIKNKRNDSLTRQGVYNLSKNCAACLLPLSGRIVEYSTGRMHYKCWYKLL